MIRPLSDARGFTLLEVMIAIGILATALVALLGLRNRDVQLQSHARNLTQATLLARDLVFEAGLPGGSELGYLEGNFGDAYPGFGWQKQVNTFLIERVWQVDVAVTWGESERVAVTRFIEAPL
ncbi:MAG: prepilin-type N-terminal cleavage/methylation domain-containing protein [Nitrospirae bacterium]|nr:prepilin-type N-terminal cleavage/methylation domain-containing protein [Nitrospirota bacterium]